MGNAAGKEHDETVLVEGSLHKEEKASLVVASSLVSKTDDAKKTVTLKGKGSSWSIVDGEESTLLFKFISKGMIKSHSIVEDAEGNNVATVITVKMGMTYVTNCILRSEPTFEGQSQLPAEDLKKAGLAEDAVLYPFSKIATERTMTTAKSTYSIITGEGDGEYGLSYTEVYTGEKLSAMNFLAIFKESGTDEGVPVAKAGMRGMTFSVKLEAANGVDLLAVVSIGYTLAGGNGANAGALAGAGVI